MKILSEDLIEEFYEREKKKYPGISFKSFKEICYNPWIFLKKEMGTFELPRIRLKYFGVFQVNKGRAKFMLGNIKKRFKQKKIKKEQYKNLKKMLKNYLNE